MTTNDTRHAASFRDPSGFIFLRNNEIYRQINQSYSSDYDRLIDSGLYQKLVDKQWLVAHEDVDVEPADAETAYKTIKPEPIPFISYPYEWSFSALKSAALTTLSIHEAALEHGMVLKDASAYNIQFIGCQPIFIDTLSFATYEEGEPWIAYRQFCQHFLAPLALMAKRDIRFGNWLSGFIDGIPLDLASQQLPLTSRLNVGLLMHLHMHAKSQTRHADTGTSVSVKSELQSKLANVSKTGMLGIVSSLRSTIRKLDWNAGKTEWGEYYSDTNYADQSMTAKIDLVGEFIEEAAPTMVWDLGGNTGRFSRIASEKGITTVSFDIDPVAVEKNFLEGQQAKDRTIFPLKQDLTNPSPAIGWHHAERQSLVERGPADTALALALIHHLAISNNVPLATLGKFFADVTKRYLIIEFVPKTDSQVQRLLTTREDIFPHYTKDQFEHEFKRHFTIERQSQVGDSERTLYLLKKQA
jgi:hypothetical protein